MTTYTWNPTSLTQFVNWNTPADWLPAVVPNAPDANVVIPEITSNGSAYPFFITIPANATYEVSSLTITDNYLIVDGALSIASTLTLGPGGEVDLAGNLSFGNLMNAGAIDIQGSGLITSPGTIDNQGAILGRGLTLAFAGLRNDGTLGASSGELDVDLSSMAAGFTNLSGGTIGIGTYLAIQGTLALNVGASIVVDAANIILEGGNSTTGQAPMIVTSDGTGGTAVPITQTLRRIASPGTLTLQEAGFTASGSLVIDGLLQLNSGTLATPGLTITPGGTAIATGVTFGGNTIDGPITNDGIIIVGPNTSPFAAGNDLVLSGTVSGTGTLEIQSSGTTGAVGDLRGNNTLEVGGPTTNAINFGDWNGVLQLDSPSLFGGAISGFTIGVNVIAGKFFDYQESSDKIILNGVSIGAITGVSYAGTNSGGTLTLQEANGSIALDLVGDYVQSNFIIAAGPQPLSSLPPSVQISEVPLAINGTTGGQVVSDQLSIAPFSKVTITDTPNQMETVNVTLSDATRGILSNLGGGSYNATTGVYTDTGTAASVTAALNGLVFTPTANDVGPGQTITTTFVINDINTAGAHAVDTTTSVVTTSASPPTTTGLLSGLNVSQQLELIYVAYFGRAADGAGFTFWGAQNVQAQTSGQSAATALTNIANSFAPQPETIALYPFLNTPTAQAGLLAFINGVYGNLFGHPSDPLGEAYWIGQLTSGTVGLGAAALAIANGALNADAIEVQNKLAVALDFTTRTAAAVLGETAPLPSSFITAANGVLKGVDGTSLNDASVTAGMNATTAYISGSTISHTGSTTGVVDGNVITVTGSNQLIDLGAGSFTIAFMPNAASDTLVLHMGGVDQVSGFDPGTDVLDLRSLLAAADIHLNGDIARLANYVTITAQAADAVVSFDPAGQGGGDPVAVLRGLGDTITGLDNLVARGAIRIA